MSDFKEFQGKNLDDAIQAACDYYEVARAKLEIEILSGGSTGIFGLVGVRKASVKARPRRGVKSVLSDEAAQETQPAVRSERHEQESLSGGDAAPMAEDKQSGAPDAPAEPADSAQAKGEGPRNSRSRRGRRPRQGRSAENAAEGSQNNGQTTPQNGGQNGAALSQEQEKPRRPRPERSRKEKPKDMPAPEQAGVPVETDAARSQGEQASRRPARKTVHHANPAPIPADRDLVPDFPPDDADDLDDMDMLGGLDDMDDVNGNDDSSSEDSGSGSRAPSLEGLDLDKLREVVTEAATALLKNLTPEPNFTVNIESDRVHVLIDDEEHSGLIIGREGQTLSALQYLANRIVSRRMEASVRVQLDTGDYRERQNDKLRDMAHELAAKAVSTGKVQSTRPLSSYHRRVVHLALQNAAGVTTRSKGEGPTKRVLILPKKSG